MASSGDGAPVRDNPDQGRYETEVEGRIGFITYRLDGETTTFIETVVPQELEGRGIGSRLARFALDDARARGRRIVPLCPFVAAYIRCHQEYEDLVAAWDTAG